jgi:hypothetical protein
MLGPQVFKELRPHGIDEFPVLGKDIGDVSVLQGVFGAVIVAGHGAGFGREGIDDDDQERQQKTCDCGMEEHHDLDTGEKR